MPTYDYACDACGHEMEVMQSITESAKKKCPKCGRLKLRRLIGAGGGLIFKGSGFYITDYRSDSYKKGKEGEGKSTDKKAEGDSSKKSSSEKSGSKSSSAKTEAKTKSSKGSKKD